MSFASLEFFLFLPAVFGLYYLFHDKRWQNGLLVLASYFFYGWWDYRFCALMLASSLIDYFGGLALAASTQTNRRKTILVTTLTLNLVLLGFFKYFNFGADSLAILCASLGWDVNTTTLNIVLPVGISFYTFQTMSYTVDIYRGDLPAKRNLVDYLTFVSFFPQLVAGPIERASTLLSQFEKARRFSPADGVAGVQFILWGLFKKMVLADNLAHLVEGAYAQPGHASGASLALATFSFAFQIYFDFSAYSEIAAGAARLFGIRLTRNFAYPYFSKTVGEFWRRWHITLSTWFRDYVYFPLGGSRGPRATTIRNLGVTFLLSGLWHGAAWKFVLWGGLHGIYLSSAHWFAGPKLWEKSGNGTDGREEATGSWLDFARIARTFLLVSLGWVFFRAESLSDAGLIFVRMATGLFSFNFYGELGALLSQNGALFLTLALLLGLEWKNRSRWNPMPLPANSTAGRWVVYTLLFWAVLVFGTARTSDFIYFQF